MYYCAGSPGTDAYVLQTGGSVRSLSRPAKGFLHETMEGGSKLLVTFGMQPGTNSVRTLSTVCLHVRVPFVPEPHLTVTPPHALLLLSRRCPSCCSTRRRSA